MTTKIQLSQIVVPQATAGQTIAVQVGGTLVASNATVSASTTSDEIDGFLLAGM